jgi:UDP-glucuronate 4-epimerase
MERDFTYIDDIVEGVVKLIDREPAVKRDWDEAEMIEYELRALNKIYNIGK